MMLLKILILLVLFLFPFGELLRMQLGNYVAIKPLDIVVGITALWWVCKVIKKDGMRFLDFGMHHTVRPFALNDKFVLPLFLFVGVGFVSLLFSLVWLRSEEFLVSLFYLLRFVSYALLLPIVMSFDKAFKKKIGMFLFIDGLVIVLFGYLQYFFYNSLKNLYHLGWDEHMHRMFSTFLDPNFASVFFVLYLIFVGGLVMKQEARSKVCSLVY